MKANMIHYYWYDAEHDEYCCVQCRRKVKFVDGEFVALIDENPGTRHYFSDPAYNLSMSVDAEQRDELDFDQINEELNGGE